MQRSTASDIKESSHEPVPGLAPNAKLVAAVPTWKRVLDITCIILSAPITIPVGVAVALVVKLSSRGPLFFYQPRVGYQEKRFTCLKFRTMTVNADTVVHRNHLVRLMSSQEPMHKLDTEGDQRVIPGGRILRALGLDELPQLINVLKGEMSLVGPRPALPYEHEMFHARHRQRCLSLPGLTGLWQVSGKNDLTFDEMIELDLHYVEHKSPWMDLGIIFKTVPVVLTLGLAAVSRRLNARRNVAHDSRSRGLPRA